MKKSASALSLALVIFIIAITGGDAQARGRKLVASNAREPRKDPGVVQCDIDPERSLVCYRCRADSDHPERDRNCHVMD